MHPTGMNLASWGRMTQLRSQNLTPLQMATACCSRQEDLMQKCLPGLSC